MKGNESFHEIECKYWDIIKEATLQKRGYYTWMIMRALSFVIKSSTFLDKFLQLEYHPSLRLSDDETLNSINEWLINKLQSIPEFKLPIDKLNNLTRIPRAILINGFSLDGSKEGKRGTGVFYNAAMFSHSCTPNSIFEYSEEKRIIEIRAVKDVKKGDELTIAYFEGSMLFTQRYKYARDQYLFMCRCELCSLQAPLWCAYCQEKLIKQARCAKCKFLHYCSKHCQKEDWADHKLVCY